MAVTIALGGDTMLGRGVGDEIARTGPYGLFGPEVEAAFARADLRLLNLECCVSDRGHPWQAPGKPFHFRAPPEAVGTLTSLGIDCVTLANNHSLDFGQEALSDTLNHLRQAGIKTVGAGRDVGEAREPAILESQGMSVAVLGVTDHPTDYAATATTPGVAYTPLSSGVPEWLTKDINQLSNIHNAVVVTPHWGPNMTTAPLPYVRRAAKEFIRAGATLVAGHSAHVFHGVAPRTLYDLGDFIDDYATDVRLRNDLSLLFRATIHPDRTIAIEALPLHLNYAHTRQATEEETDWIKTRLTEACTEFATKVTQSNHTLTIEPANSSKPNSHR
jgi:poly-gamma-glutamate synthesis protein (capsule biosynthesis protein)